MQSTEDEQDHGHSHSHGGVGDLEEDVNTIPYWLDTAPPFEDGATDSLPDKVDAAIIGGGLTGLSAAIKLARKGAQVIVFEKDTVGFGASGRNGGMSTPGLATDAAGVLKKHGLDRAKEMYLSFNAAIDYVEKLIIEEKIDCNFECTGKFTVAAKPHHYDHLVKRHEFLAEHFGYTFGMIYGLSSSKVR